MVAKRFEELIAWQRAAELKQGVLAFTAREHVCRDFKYCNQIRESTRSATRNTAEGFGRYYPKDFMRFLRIAAGSLHETMDHLHEGLDRGYVDADEHERLVRLAKRALKANTRLQAYLRTARPPNPRHTSKQLDRSEHAEHDEPSEPSTQ
jgi:four helix bundle protein